MTLSLRRAGSPRSEDASGGGIAQSWSTEWHDEQRSLSPPSADTGRGTAARGAGEASLRGGALGFEEFASGRSGGGSPCLRLLEIVLTALRGKHAPAVNCCIIESLCGLYLTVLNDWTTTLGGDQVLTVVCLALRQVSAETRAYIRSLVSSTHFALPHLKSPLIANSDAFKKASALPSRVCEVLATQSLDTVNSWLSALVIVVARDATLSSDSASRRRIRSGEAKSIEEPSSPRARRSVDHLETILCDDALEGPLKEQLRQALLESGDGHHLSSHLKRQHSLKVVAGGLRGAFRRLTASMRWKRGSEATERLDGDLGGAEAREGCSLTSSTLAQQLFALFPPESRRALENGLLSAREPSFVSHPQPSISSDLSALVEPYMKDLIDWFVSSVSAAEAAFPAAALQVLSKESLTAVLGGMEHSGSDGECQRECVAPVLSRLVQLDAAKATFMCCVHHWAAYQAADALRSDPAVLATASHFLLPTLLDSGNAASTLLTLLPHFLLYVYMREVKGQKSDPTVWLDPLAPNEQTKRALLSIPSLPPLLRSIYLRALIKHTSRCLSRASRAHPICPIQNIFASRFDARHSRKGTTEASTLLSSVLCGLLLVASSDSIDAQPCLEDESQTGAPVTSTSRLHSHWAPQLLATSLATLLDYLSSRYRWPASTCPESFWEIDEPFLEGSYRLLVERHLLDLICHLKTRLPHKPSKSSLEKLNRRTSSRHRRRKSSVRESVLQNSLTLCGIDISTLTLVELLLRNNVLRASAWSGVGAEPDFLMGRKSSVAGQTDGRGVRGTDALFQAEKIARTKSKINDYAVKRGNAGFVSAVSRRRDGRRRARVYSGSRSTQASKSQQSIHPALSEVPVLRSRRRSTFKLRMLAFCGKPSVVRHVEPSLQMLSTSSSSRSEKDFLDSSDADVEDAGIRSGKLPTEAASTRRGVRRRTRGKRKVTIGRMKIRVQKSRGHGIPFVSGSQKRPLTNGWKETSSQESIVMSGFRTAARSNVWEKHGLGTGPLMDIGSRMPLTAQKTFFWRCLCQAAWRLWPPAVCQLLIRNPTSRSLRRVCRGSMNVEQERWLLTYLSLLHPEYSYDPLLRFVFDQSTSQRRKLAAFELAVRQARKRLIRDRQSMCKCSCASSIRDQARADLASLRAKSYLMKSSLIPLPWLYSPSTLVHFPSLTLPILEGHYYAAVLLRQLLLSRVQLCDFTVSAELHISQLVASLMRDPGRVIEEAMMKLCQLKPPFALLLHFHLSAGVPEEQLQRNDSTSVPRGPQMRLLRWLAQERLRRKEAAAAYQVELFESLITLSGELLGCSPSDREVCLKTELQKRFSDPDGQVPPACACFIPSEPDLQITRFHIKEAKTLQSAAKVPFLLKCSVQDPKKRQGLSRAVSADRAFIFKFFDDVRQDHLALMLITLCKRIFDRALLPLFLKPYNVIPYRRVPLSDLGQDDMAFRKMEGGAGQRVMIGGVMEVVPHTISRHQLGAALDCSLAQFFRDFYTNERNQEAGAYSSAQSTPMGATRSTGDPSRTPSAAVVRTHRLPTIKLLLGPSAEDESQGVVTTRGVSHTSGLPRPQCSSSALSAASTVKEEGDRAREMRKSSPFRKAQWEFLRSLAAYSLVSYLLQVKDRHNGNLLLTDRGQILHIDFGFLFDTSPGRDLNFEKAPFKLTTEMIEVLGGSVQSKEFALFEQLMVQGFLLLREEADQFLEVIAFLAESGLPCLKEQSLRNFSRRFQLQLTPHQAAQYMRRQIVFAYRSLTTKIYDVVQYIQQGIKH